MLLFFLSVSLARRAFRIPPFNSLYDPFGSPSRGTETSGKKKETALLVLFVRKPTRPSLPLRKAPPLISVFSPQGRRGKPPSGARNRYALGVADHQRSAPGFAGWDRMEKVCYSNTFCFDNSFNEATNQKCHYAYRCRLKVEYLTVYFIIQQDSSLIHPNH